jgi:hypothetical protein
MRSGVRSVSASATCVVPWKSSSTMSCAGVSAFAKTSIARTPPSAVTVAGPFVVSQPPSSGGSVPENGSTVGAGACAARPVASLSLSTSDSRASTAPVCASTKTRYAVGSGPDVSRTRFSNARM